MLNEMSPGCEARGDEHNVTLDTKSSAQQMRPGYYMQCLQCVWPQAISGKEWVTAAAQKHRFRHWPHTVSHMHMKCSIQNPQSMAIVAL